MKWSSGCTGTGPEKLGYLGDLWPVIVSQPIYPHKIAVKMKGKENTWGGRNQPELAEGGQYKNVEN